jgi:hypothetical protein
MAALDLPSERRHSLSYVENDSLVIRGMRTSMYIPYPYRSMEIHRGRNTMDQPLYN